MNKILLTLVLAFFVTSAPSSASTVYTGDTIQGRSVISELDVSDLAPGQTYEFYFQTVQNNIGQYWYIPVTVIKGHTEGKRVTLVAGTHGNELNGVPVVARIKNTVKPEELNGTITILHYINVPGAIGNTRHYDYSGVEQVDDKGPESVVSKFTYDYTGKDLIKVPKLAVELASSAVWHKLLDNNTDHLIDLHDHSAGLTYALFVYVDAKYPGTLEMAKYLEADAILLEAHAPGVGISEVMNSLGRPSAVIEIGPAEQHDELGVQRTYRGILNFFKHLQMLPGNAKVHEHFYANVPSYVEATGGGYAVVHVELNQVVEQGDLFATQYDPFGNEVRKYYAYASGKVIEIAHNPYNEDVYWALGGVYYYDPDHKTQTLPKK